MDRPPVGRRALPSELWEGIILRLPPIEIPSMRLLNRNFCELIDRSPVIKYNLDLFSAGLEERTAGDPLGIQDRRQKLETYCSRWERVGHPEPILLGPPPFPNFRNAYVDKGFLIYDEDAGGEKENIYFMRLPSPAMEVPQIEWIIRGLPASSVYGHERAIYLPLDLLAIPVSSEDATSFQIQMFHMSDGKPYLNDVHPTVMGSSYGTHMRIFRVSLELTSCRISATVLNGEMGFYDAERDDVELFVWDWRTGKMCLHVQTGIITAHFIDEYRLVGSVRRGRGVVLVLWDTGNDRSHLPGLVFEIGPHHTTNLDLGVHDHEMGHALPFCENHSMGLVAFSFRAKEPYLSATGERTYIIPVGALVRFTQMMGTFERVPWEEWQHFTTPIGLRLVPSHTYITHSQVLSVHRANSSPRSTSILRIHDFSLRSRRRKVQDDPSVPLPPYTVQEFPLNASYRSSLFEFTEGGILVTSDVGGGTRCRYFLTI